MLSSVWVALTVRTTLPQMPGKIYFIVFYLLVYALVLVLHRAKCLQTVRI